jgi:transposase-like protein
MSDNIIQLNEELIKTELKDLVRSSVEETLNALLDKEADELVNAEKYERSGEHRVTDQAIIREIWLLRPEKLS